MISLPPLHADYQNVGSGERWLSAVVGGLLVLWGLERFSARSLAAALAGVSLLHRGVTGYCAVSAALGIHTPTRPEEDEVEEASIESFPASDAPAWTGTAVGGPVRTS